MKRALVTTAVVGVLAVAGGCVQATVDPTGGTDTSPGGLASSGAGEAMSFTARAATLCTEAVNDHHLAPDLHPGLEALQAITADERPEPERISAWAADLAALVAHHEQIREQLATLTEGTEAEQAAWKTVVAAGDADLEVMRDRLALLEAGDWDEVAANFPRRDQGDAGAGEELLAALATLELHGTDCVAPYSGAAWQVPEENAPFVRAATTTCTSVVLRRLAEGYAEHEATTLDLVRAVTADGWSGEVPDGTEEATEQLVKEWERTANDFSLVDTSTAVDPAQWQASVSAAKGMAELYRNRLAALSSGEADAIRTAWQPSNAPAGDLAANGLRERSCAGVSF